VWFLEDDGYCLSSGTAFLESILVVDRDPRPHRIEEGAELRCLVIRAKSDCDRHDCSHRASLFEELEGVHDMGYVSLGLEWWIKDYGRKLLNWLYRKEVGLLDAEAEASQHIAVLLLDLVASDVIFPNDFSADTGYSANAGFRLENCLTRP